jgi:YjbE family integral membrane protein
VTPEFLSSAWWSALASIIVIDLVLAGDNAIVIGLAARNVPRERQRIVVLWGTAGAIGVRILLTLVVVWLLRIPGFLVAGGAALCYIAWKLTRGGDPGHAVEARTSVRGAIRTIVIADAVMGVDNVLAVGGAAHGSLWLVVIGLAISVPIVVWGSTLVLKWVDRFPQILWLGAAVLGWTAAKMIASEPLTAPYFDAMPWLRTLLFLVVVGALIAVPVWRALASDTREQSLAVGAMLGWVTLFGFIERELGLAFDPIDDWQWDREIIDLARWIGWIPLVLLIRGRTASRPSTR